MFGVALYRVVNEHLRDPSPLYITQKIHDSGYIMCVNDFQTFANESAIEQLSGSSVQRELKLPCSQFDTHNLIST